MWHDAWPPLPPGGHRPPDAPPFTSPGDQLLALGLGATAGAGALVWATGQLAGLAFGQTWLELSPGDVAHVLGHLPQHWSDPALAWPVDVRGPLPGPARPACTPPSPAWSAASAAAPPRCCGTCPDGPPATGRGTPGRPSMPAPSGPAAGSCASSPWASPSRDG